MTRNLKIARTVSRARKFIREQKKNTRSIGFVATMGALHAGHISLVKTSLEENDITVVSIFVNPNQFNDNHDFNSYPRNLQEDLQILKSYAVDLVFVPSTEEVYPEPDTRVFDFSGLDLIMEGKYRPGHFNGVAQVVSRLFEIIEPDRAYFGEKDFQQLAIIRKVVKDLNIPVQIRGCPIIRQADGLAMSSRNKLLTVEEQKSATRIFRALQRAKALAGKLPVTEFIEQTCKYIQEDPCFRVEYFEIVRQKDLQPVQNWNENDPMIACIAVQIGRVRLIDNIKFSS